MESKFFLLFDFGLYSFHYNLSIEKYLFLLFSDAPQQFNNQQDGSSSVVKLNLKEVL